MTADSAASIEASLASERFGHPLQHYPIALTTEALALGWARQEDAPEGACVVADQELAARQRKGPPWTVFPELGLYFSVVLRPGLPPEGEGLLWLLASLAAAEGLQEWVGSGATVKWPDDVLVGGRKIAGVKVEAQLSPGAIESAVLTFRVNVDVDAAAFPAEIRESATSVLVEAGTSPGRWAVMDGILQALERVYDGGVPSLLDGYRSRCETLGRRVRAVLLPRGEVVGKADSVDDAGALVVVAGTSRAVVQIDALKKLESPGSIAPPGPLSF